MDVRLPLRSYSIRLAKAAGEIVAHFLITVLSLLAIAGTSFLMDLLGLTQKPIPLVGITLGEWMFILEITTATIINLFGIYKCIVAYGDI
jgi:hypothetical protein